MGGLSVKDALQVLPPLKRGGGSDHCPKYLLISSQIPGSTRMFISLGLLSAPALGILQIRKKNLDLGLSIPFWAKFQPPIGELYRLELNINSFLQTLACSFMS